MNLDKLRAELTLEEGARLAAYRDSEGILTVGIGHNCIARPVEGVSAPGDTITQETSDALFTADCDDAIKQLDEALPWWAQLDDVRQNVLLDMAFNIGIRRLQEFHHMLDAAESGDYLEAARQMANSKWAAQVGSRARRLEAMMSTGEWQL